jgi:hypothetical protein
LRFGGDAAASLTILAVVLTACGSGQGIAPGPDAAFDDRPFEVEDAAAAIDTTDAPAEAALDDVEADVDDRENDAPSDALDQSADLRTDELPEGPVACGPLTCAADQYCFASTGSDGSAPDYHCSLPPASCGTAPTCACFLKLVFDACQFSCQQIGRTFNCSDI